MVGINKLMKLFSLDFPSNVNVVEELPKIILETISQSILNATFACLKFKQKKSEASGTRFAQLVERNVRLISFDTKVDIPNTICNLRNKFLMVMRDYLVMV